MSRGVGYINSRATSGYTSISLTRETRRLLRELQDLTGAKADELVLDMVRERLDLSGYRDRDRDSIESHRSEQKDVRDSIDQAPPSSETPEAE